MAKNKSVQGSHVMSVNEQNAIRDQLMNTSNIEGGGTSTQHDDSNNSSKKNTDLFADFNIIKNILIQIHKSIIQQNKTLSNTNPSNLGSNNLREIFTNLKAVKTSLESNTKSNNNNARKTKDVYDALIKISEKLTSLLKNSENTRG